MKKYNIDELEIIPVKVTHARQVELTNGIWLHTVGDGTAYDESETEWSEIPGLGFAKVPLAQINFLTDEE